MKQSCDIIIKAGILATQNMQRDIVYDAGIAIRGDSIIAVGNWQQIDAQWESADFFDFSDKLVMPGLVNSHTHIAMTFLRGLADDMQLMQWLTEHVFPVEKHLTADIVEAGALLACAEMARTGTTTFCDMYLIEDATYKAVDKAGLRMQGGEGIFIFPSPAYADTKAAFDLVRRQHDKYKGHARIRQAIMPHAVYTSTPELLGQCKDLADELGCGLHIHLAETVTETAQCIESFGKRPVPYCHDLGLLRSGTTIAHAVDVTDDELALLYDTGVAVAHNPESNMKLASGVARIPEMLKIGIPVGLGTDGAASNNDLNMFTEMATCALLHKLQCMDPTCAPAQKVFDMATLGGGRCTGWPEVGSIEPAKKADIIALDLKSPNLQPLYSPVSHAVYAASGHEVTHTMVGGEFVFRDGKFTRFDYDALLKDIAGIKQWVLKRLA
ncbi:amidohydrolase [Oleidesulfovibrio sp.]|uniref:amidohydrolase n=1 Tax=Oleidesulfovibrio sp. TaxID=2909707 RepID=UPI003A85F0C7